MKTHVYNSLTPGSLPAYLANGLVGVRVNPIPLPRGTALVNGFVGVSPEVVTEEYADAPYPVGADISWNGVWLSSRPDLARFQEQRYDFSCGELTSRFSFCGARVEVLTFCSRTQPTLTLQQITVEVDKPGEMILQGHLDQRGLPGRLKYRCMPKKVQDGVLEWESAGALGTVGAAYSTEFIGEGLKRRVRNDYGHETDMELTRYHVEAKPGQRYVLRQAGSLVPSLMHDEPNWQAARHVGFAQMFGFEQLRDNNRAAWAELWKGRLRISGAAAEQWQDVADAAFFYVHSSIAPHSPCSVAPYGLAHRTGYHGHVFWDADSYIMPAVLLTAPQSARAMMDYRAERVATARATPRLNGCRGLLFPWQTLSSGSEVTAYYAGTAGGLQAVFMNMEVALAAARYVHATGDDLFLKQCAWPILQGVAEWIISRATKTPRGYELRNVSGPDEYIENVHNNAYTNMTAIATLREAIGFARQLGFEAPQAWRNIERGFYLPLDEKTRVLLKHDGYSYKGGICVPETLLGFYPVGYRADPAVEAATYKFHLELADTFLGMPIFSAFCSVWAARQGDRKRAALMLDAGVKATLVQPYDQFLESSPAMIATSGYGAADASVFLTNGAEFLMAGYLGLPGIHIDGGSPAEWCKYPVVLPEGWDSIEVDRLWIRGRPMRLHAKHGAARATLEAIA